MNQTPKYNNSNLNPSYNNFNINLNLSKQEIIFNSYNLTKLPNCLNCNKQIINSIIYYVITIENSTQFLKVNDNITIINSDNITVNNIPGNTNFLLIDKSYINKTFPIYSININSYDIILGESNIIKTVDSCIWINNSGYDY
jgi:hypothetical protein